MSEAGSGNTRELLARHQHFATALAVVAAALWAFAIAAAAGTIADQLPDLIAGSVLALAGTATVLAGTLAAGHLRQRITLEVAAADRAELRELVAAAVREQMNDTLDLTPLVIGMARIADRVRELAETAGDGAPDTQIPTAVRARIYDLGRRTSGGEDAN